MTVLAGLVGLVCAWLAVSHRPLDLSNPQHRELIARAARHGARYRNIRGARWVRLNPGEYLLIEEKDA